MKMFRLIMALAFLVKNTLAAAPFTGTVIMNNREEIYSQCDCKDNWLFFKDDNGDPLLYVKQKPNGKLIIRTGDPGNSEALWKTNLKLPKGRYFSRLQDNCNLITRAGTDKTGDVVWESDTIVRGKHSCFFGVTKDLMAVEIWKGTPNNPEALLFREPTKKTPSAQQGFLIESIDESYTVLLNSSDVLKSTDGPRDFIESGVSLVQQRDGNIVLYRSTASNWMWMSFYSDISNPNEPNYYTQLSKNGILRTYPGLPSDDPKEPVVWRTPTQETDVPKDDCFLVLSSDQTTLYIRSGSPGSDGITVWNETIRVL